MTSGVSDLGESGCCFGEADRDLLREEYDDGAGSGWEMSSSKMWLSSCIFA